MLRIRQRPCLNYAALCRHTCTYSNGALPHNTRLTTMLTPTALAAFALVAVVLTAAYAALATRHPLLATAGLACLALAYMGGM